MSASIDAVSPPLAAYASALRDVRPSRALDARIDALIHDSASATGRSSGRRWKAIAGVAAASAAVLIGFIVLWIVLGEREAASVSPETAFATVAHPVQEDADPGFSVLSTGQYSLWPTEAAVLRVRARLGATATLAPDGAVTDERRFWVDVRIANDGSMRIVRVVPADEEWLFESEEESRNERF